MILINLTPHNINLYKDGKITKIIPSSGIATCETKSLLIDNIDGFDVYTTEFGEVSNLPAPKDGVYYIVSAIVANKVKGTRSDCLIVNDTVRNEKGQIIGCKSFGKIL